MSYKDAILERVHNPVSVGLMDENDPEVGIGLVGAPACGDVIQFSIRVREGKIVDAKFKTFGCGSAIASSSLLVEKANGKTLEQAMGITNMEIYEELGLPPIKLHCSVLAEEAIQAAIENWQSKSVTP